MERGHAGCRRNDPMRKTIGTLGVLSTLGLLLGACQGAGLSRGMQSWVASRPPQPIRAVVPDAPVPATQPDASQPRTTQPGSRPAQAPLQMPQFRALPPNARAYSGGKIRISNQELRPIDAWFDPGGSPGTRWITGRVVDVVASKEYFSGKLSLVRTPWVVRNERQLGSGLLTTLTFIGSQQHASMLDVRTAPTVRIGCLTITASETLRVHLVKTRNPRAPVRLQVRSTGNATQGSGGNVLRKAESLLYGGYLLWNGRRWVWTPFEK